jgi:hypothetical protein
MKLSVIIPFFDGRATLGELLKRAEAVPISLEIIRVDDPNRPAMPLKHGEPFSRRLQLSRLGQHHERLGDRRYRWRV